MVAVADKSDLVEVPLVGVGYRGPLENWISTEPDIVGCLEITAEHFFDGGRDRLAWLADRFPLFVHGLGLSLGTPGPLDQATLGEFKRIVDTARPMWISEHIAFTRSEETDLGHLNPIPTSRRSLAVMVDHAKELSDVCQRPLILENITSHITLKGELSEPQFLNELCDRTGCGLLLDATNLFINSRNHRFDPLQWLDELNLSNVVQMHVVGYSFHDGVWSDHHGAAIQDELFELVEYIVARSPVRAVIIERDAHFPPITEIESELRRLEEVCESARLHNRTGTTA